MYIVLTLAVIGWLGSIIAARRIVARKQGEGQ